MTELQFRVLEAITAEKIENAPLLELAKSFSILEKAMEKIKGKDSIPKISGLLRYLMEIEKLA